MNSQTVALPVLDVMDILPGAQHLALGWLVGSGDQFKQGCFSRTVGPHNANDLRLINFEIRLKPKGFLLVEKPALVDFTKPVDL